MITAELQGVVASVNSRPKCKYIAFKFAAKYFCTVVKRVRITKEEHDDQRKRSIT